MISLKIGFLLLVAFCFSGNFSDFFLQEYIHRKSMTEMVDGGTRFYGYLNRIQLFNGQ